MIDQKNITQHTKKWLECFVIKHNICPFAKREFDNNAIHYEVVVSDKVENQLQELIYSCEQLDKETDISDNTENTAENRIETSLLILPNGLDAFDDFLDFLYLANDLMHQQGYEGIYQLASFHPDYCFEGVEPEDASHYTNRSPYPMLHLIREDSIEKVLKLFPNPESIPTRNIEFTREMGSKALQDLVKNCKQ